MLFLLLFHVPSRPQPSCFVSVNRHGIAAEPWGESGSVAQLHLYGHLAFNVLTRVSSFTAFFLLSIRPLVADLQAQPGTQGSWLLTIRLSMIG